MIGQNIAILSSHWLQAYFEKMKLPFTGSGAEETRFGLNKVTDRCPHHQKPYLCQNLQYKNK